MTFMLWEAITWAGSVKWQMGSQSHCRDAHRERGEVEQGIGDLVGGNFSSHVDDQGILLT